MDDGYGHLRYPDDYQYEIVEKNSLQDQEITSLIEQRNQARKDLDYKRADTIRTFLKKNGIALMDEKGGRGKVALIIERKKFSFNILTHPPSSVG